MRKGINVKTSMFNVGPSEIYGKVERMKNVYLAVDFECR